MKIEYLRLSHADEFNWFERVFLSLINGLKGTPLQHGQLENHKQEFIKLYLAYFLSVRQLVEGVVVIEAGTKGTISALPSVLTLTRSCLENYSLFYYIYVADKTEESIYYKYWSWWREGLLRRQRLFTSSEEIEQKRKEEQQKIEQIWTELALHPSYKALTSRTKSKYRKFGEWHDHSMVDLLHMSGFNRALAQTIYSYLSCYAHSSSASILQTSQADHETADGIMKTMCNALFISAALYAKVYSELWPQLQTLLSAEDTEFLESWIELGKRVGNPQGDP